MGYEEEKMNGYTTNQDLIETSGKHAYNLQLKEGDRIKVNLKTYRVINTNFENSPSSGMQAMLLENIESKELIIAYQGTNMSDIKDLMTDVGLAGNVTPPQLLDAKKYYGKYYQYNNI